MIEAKEKGFNLFLLFYIVQPIELQDSLISNISYN